VTSSLKVSVSDAFHIPSTIGFWSEVSHWVLPQAWGKEEGSVLEGRRLRTWQVYLKNTPAGTILGSTLMGLLFVHTCLLGVMCTEHAHGLREGHDCNSGRRRRHLHPMIDVQIEAKRPDKHDSQHHLPLPLTPLPFAVQTLETSPSSDTLG
jgi:hypothetical protein